MKKKEKEKEIAKKKAIIQAVKEKATADLMPKKRLPSLIQATLLRVLDCISIFNRLQSKDSYC